MNIKKILSLFILQVALTSVYLNKASAQIIINADVIGGDGSDNFVGALNTSNQVVPINGTITFFWWDPTIVTSFAGYTKASDFNSLLSTNTLWSLSIPNGVPGLSGQFTGESNIITLLSAAEGKPWAGIITATAPWDSNTSLFGVFGFGNLPNNSATPPPNKAYAILPDSTIIKGSTTVSTINYGDGALPATAYLLVPEPSTGALMMIGAVGLVALRRLRKV